MYGTERLGGNSSVAWLLWLHKIIFPSISLSPPPPPFQNASFDISSEALVGDCWELVAKAILLPWLYSGYVWLGLSVYFLTSLEPNYICRELALFTVISGNKVECNIEALCDHAPPSQDWIFVCLHSLYMENWCISCDDLCRSHLKGAVTFHFGAFNCWHLTGIIWLYVDSSGQWGREGLRYLTLHCHHQNDSALRRVAVWAILLFH